MAKRQNFIVGSTNAVTENLTNAQLDAAFDRYEILTADKLDGVFNAVSDYSNDSSNEIANAIQSITGSQPTGATQDELASALQQMRSEIETTSLTFKGYVSSTEPSVSDYDFKVGDIWIQSATMPTVFPVAIAGIWDGAQWATTTDTYTQKDFDFFRDINNGEGYYWFGGEWTIMSTDMDTTYFELNPSGKWAIKPDIDLPGSPTTTTATTTDDSTKIATTAFVKNVLQGYVPTGNAANTSLSNLVDAGKNISNWSTNVTNCITEIPQDIKLELNAGTLTLKAGSKVYVPNGSNPSSDVNNFVVSGLNANLGNHNWYPLAYGAGKFVALGDSYGYISTSTDGINWAVASQNANLGSHSWRALAYDGTKFVALGYSAFISTSTDGTNWTVATQNSNLVSHTWWCLAYGAGKFVALGLNGNVSTSTDGTNWTVATQNSNLGYKSWENLAYDGTKFVALGKDGYISTSTDGTNWTVATQNSNLGSNDWRGLVYDGTKFVALGATGYISVTVSGLTFNTVTIDNDINIGMGTGSYTKMAFVKPDGTTASVRQIAACYSGSTAPSGYPNMAWYDTANNLMKFTEDNGSTWTSGYSFPVAIATITSDVITGIDQIFNGFGYIGNTKFVLPNVKGLIPNGRNADGTLKNTEFTTNYVMTKTGQSTDSVVAYFNGSSIENYSSKSITYELGLNRNKNNENGTYLDMIPYTHIYHQTNGRIDFCNFNKTFQALNRADVDFISILAMPSWRYINLTFANGGSFIAPGNGYFFLSGFASNPSFSTVGGIISADGGYQGNFTVMSNSTYVSRWILPVSKGEKVTMYLNGGTVDACRFIYAYGSI